MSSDNATAPPTDRRPAAADPAGTGHEPGANRQAGRVRRPGGIRPAGTVPPARTPRRRPRASRRRAVSIILAGCLSLGAAAGLAQGITACQPAVQPDTSRPLAAAEADRLARMRLQNYQDGRAGFRATIGQPGRQVRLTGWVDWQRTLAYFTVRSARPVGENPAAENPAAEKSAGENPAGENPAREKSAGAPGPFAPDSTEPDGLVQVIPGLIATRPGSISTGTGQDGTGQGKDGPLAPAPTEEPPAEPPADGWQVRRLALSGDTASALDAFAVLLFTIASDRADAADLLARSDARWLRRDLTDGVSVDVLVGPAVPPRAGGQRPVTVPGSADPRASSPASGRAEPGRPIPTSLAAMGGAVRYWLDDDARVRRLETLLASNLPVRMDLDRGRHPELSAIEALGGRPVAPRKVTAAQAKTLALMRKRNLKSGGGTLTVTVPTTAGVQRAKGWLSWADPVAYLAIASPNRATPITLIYADRHGIARHPAARTGGAVPPLPPPGGRWQFSPWRARGDANGAFDLDLLLGEALTLAAPAPGDAATVRTTAVYLRFDVVGRVPVTVYELPKPIERGAPPGGARLRYWVDQAGVLRRLELRTRAGAFAQLDITPAKLPAIRPVRHD